MFDMFNMLGKISNMGKQMRELKEELKKTQLTETDAEGMITVTMNANKEFESITISDRFMQQSQQDAQRILQETLSNAYSQASIKGRHQVNEQIEGKIPNIPGFDLQDMPFF